MVTADSVRQVLEGVPDPELPISIWDLGIVLEIRITPPNGVEVKLQPTFMGCPALLKIEEAVREALDRAGICDVKVAWDNSNVWTAGAVSARGARVLHSYGVNLPAECCPHCGSQETAVLGEFGPTLCRRICYCRSCRTPFEQIKEIVP